MSRRPLAAATLGLLLAAVTACGGTSGADPAAAPDADDHGEIAGAVELAEPPLGLTAVDAAGGVRHLDLLDESVRELADVAPPQGLHTDGRFLYVQGEDGVSVLDSGVWTWDHVDHFHYYRAEPREVGLVEGSGRATVATTSSSTSGGAGVLFSESGEAVLLDVAQLADGAAAELFRLQVEPHDGLLVPVGSHALLSRPDDSGEVAAMVVVDAEGVPVDGAEHECPRASGTITTRVGAVVGCADGALLATAGDDGPVVERIPYPANVSAPAATDFANRDGRPTVAALAGPDRIWLLDTRERSWMLLESPVPLAQVTAVDDDDEHVVGLTTDGRVAVIDGESGDLLARTRPLAEESLRDGPGRPTLVVDQQRAYLSAPSERRLHEIDFADDARISRTFETPTEPAYVAGTGR